MDQLALQKPALESLGQREELEKVPRNFYLKKRDFRRVMATLRAARGVPFSSSERLAADPTPPRSPTRAQPSQQAASLCVAVTCFSWSRRSTDAIHAWCGIGPSGDPRAMKSTCGQDHAFGQFGFSSGCQFRLRHNSGFGQLAEIELAEVERTSPLVPPQSLPALGHTR